SSNSIGTKITARAIRMTAPLIRSRIPYFICSPAPRSGCLRLLPCQYGRYHIEGTAHQHAIVGRQAPGKPLRAGLWGLGLESDLPAACFDTPCQIVSRAGTLAHERRRHPAIGNAGERLDDAVGILVTQHAEQDPGAPAARLFCKPSRQVSCGMRDRKSVV